MRSIGDTKLELRTHYKWSAKPLANTGVLSRDPQNKGLNNIQYAIYYVLYLHGFASGNNISLFLHTHNIQRMAVTLDLSCKYALGVYTIHTAQS